MIEWLENYAKSLVDHPDQVSVSTKEGVITVQVNLQLAEEDAVVFSGRHNRLLRAMNSVLSLAGARSRKRYILKVVS